MLKKHSLDPRSEIERFSGRDQLLKGISGVNIEVKVEFSCLCNIGEENFSLPFRCYQQNLINTTSFGLLVAFN